MTGEEALRQLTALKDNGDTEMAHSEADSILCELLIETGYDDVVKAWQQIKKWYA